MKRVEQRNNICETYESISDLLTTLDAREYTDDLQNWETYKRGDGGESYTPWNGETSWTDATNMLIYGESKAVDAMNVNLHSTLDTDTRPARVRCVAGNLPIVPNAIIGLPKSMIKRDARPLKNKVVTLSVDIARNASTDTDEMIEYGVRVVSFIKALEHKGVRVRVYVLCAMGYEHKRAIMRLLVKNESTPLDIKRLCFPIANPAMFRVIGFDWYERVPLPVIHDGGYGREIKAGETCSLDFIKSLDAKSIYVNHTTDLTALAKQL